MLTETKLRPGVVARVKEVQSSARMVGRAIWQNEFSSQTKRP